jgi:hypothetical protein
MIPIRPIPHQTKSLHGAWTPLHSTEHTNTPSTEHRDHANTLTRPLRPQVGFESVGYRAAVVAEAEGGGGKQLLAPSSSLEPLLTPSKLAAPWASDSARGSPERVAFTSTASTSTQALGDDAGAALPLRR